jgi:ligand-binding sensor domain-containing protein
VQADGSLKFGEKCYVLRKEKPGKGGSNVGNMVFDTKGRLFVAMPEGVQYFDEEMRFSGQLSRPIREPVRMVILSNDRLFIACGASVWVRKVKSMGVTPTKP